MNTNDRKALEQLAGRLLADRQTAEITAASESLLNDADRLRQLAAKWRNVSPEIAQGRMFEQLTTVRFNLDALQKGRLDVRAFTTDSVGRPHDPVDIILEQGRRRIGYQAKSCDDYVRSLVSLTDKLDERKYRGLMRLPPSEQYEKIKALLEKRVKSGALKQEQYSDPLRNLRRELELDGVSSGATTRAEALAATGRKAADKMASRFESRTIAVEMHRSGLEAGRTGAWISGGVSSVDGIVRLAHGQAGFGEVTAQVVVDTAKGYASSYVTTAISKGVPHILLKAGAEKATVGALTKSNAHLAIAAGVVECGKSLVQYVRGDISGEQLMSAMSHTAVTGASAFYYGALGQALIPIPIVGAFVGSTVGYFVGNVLHQSGLIALGESSVVRASRVRREHIEALCLTAIPLMRAHRLELECLIESEFRERAHVFKGAFDDLEGALTGWDADHFTECLERVNNAFGSGLPFRTLEEFDAFMLDDQRPFVL